MKRVDIFSKKYYTDYHNVDEDVLTITAHGGFWTSEGGAGPTYRYMTDAPTESQGGVASSNVQNIELYGLA